MIVALACLLGAIFVWLEWRRANRRQRLLRIAAVLLATAALALMAEPPPRPSAHLLEAALWTGGAGSIRLPDGVTAAFALPEAETRPASAQVITDVAALRRRHPELRKLHVFGQGLNAFEARALRGLRIEGIPWVQEPTGFTFVRAAPEVVLGQPWPVQGRVVETPAAATIELAGAEGMTTGTVSAEGRFSVASPPAAALGRFMYHLRLRDGDTVVADEMIGVSVVPPAVPRLLVLESAPRLDTARLKRWYAELGGTLAARTQIGRQRSRDAALGEARADFAQLDAAVLAGFDLVIADGGALSALSADERESLRIAIIEKGLGVLILGDAAAAASLATFQLEPVASPEPGAIERLVRPRWSGMTTRIEAPIPAEPFAIKLAADQRALALDAQEHVLVAATTLERGRVALTLLRDTWRWPQANEPAAFAAYWSHLLSELARPAPATKVTWSFAQEDTLPAFVDQPLDLICVAEAAEVRGPATIRAGDTSMVLPLAQQPDDSRRWRGTFWPRESGWHRVALGGGGREFAFFVSERNAWQARQVARRKEATERLEAEPGEVSSESPNDAPKQPEKWLLFAAFAAAAGYLWAERRLGGRLPVSR